MVGSPPRTALSSDSAPRLAAVSRSPISCATTPAQQVNRTCHRSSPILRASASPSRAAPAAAAMSRITKSVPITQERPNRSAPSDSDSRAKRRPRSSSSEVARRPLSTGSSAASNARQSSARARTSTGTSASWLCASRSSNHARARVKSPWRIPERGEVRGELQAARDVAVGHEPSECRVQVVAIGDEPRQLVPLVELRRAPREGHEPVGVSGRHPLRLTGLGEQLTGVVDDRGKQPVPRLAGEGVRLDQVHVHEAREGVQEPGGSPHAFGRDRAKRVDGAPAREHGHPAEQGLLPLPEEAVAPRDGGPQLHAAPRPVAVSEGRQVERRRRVEHLQQGRRRESRHARGRELDREGQPVESLDEPGDRRGVVHGAPEARVHRARPLAEQRHRRGALQLLRV